jgi:hypothetical protein
MKIEISEVFVTRSDSMSMDCESSAVGIAALEPRKKRAPPNIKNRRFTLFHGISRFFTPKKIHSKPVRHPISISPSDTFCRFLTASDTKKRILFIKLNCTKVWPPASPAQIPHRGFIKLL